MAFAAGDGEDSVQVAFADGAAEGEGDSLVADAAPEEGTSGEALVSAYAARVSAAVGAQRRELTLARRFRLAGTSVVRLLVGPDGRVVERALSSTSGSDVLDEEALRMVSAADPLPTPPTDAPLSLFVPIRFETRD